MDKPKKILKEAFVGFRAPQSLVDQIDKAAKSDPDLSRSYLARRGFELALKELEKRK